jgi:hypothetical protein
MFTAALAAILCGADEPKLESGPRVGEIADMFSVRAVTGPHRGKTLCYRCALGNSPVVCVLARRITAPLESLIKQLDEGIASRSDGLKSLVVFLTDAPNDTETKLEALAARSALNHVPLTLYRNRHGPQDYRIDDRAEVTILMWEGPTVTFSQAFAHGKITEADVSRVLLLLMVPRATAGDPGGRISGPLRVHPGNPRYFADGSGRAIYLTGSHTWSNLQDQGPNDPPPRFDFVRYLDFLRERNHNFIRLWAWEQARWAPWSDGKGQNPSGWFVAPNPYARTGPGTALDAKPKFNLAKFDETYFERLRSRVRQAGERGIYVSVMLFQGWSSAKDWLGGKPWRGHPYHPDNNIQEFNGNTQSDSGPDLNDPRVRERHVAYIKKVIDTLSDADNLLFEVTNEGGNKGWDRFVVDAVHAYEKTKRKQHPVGLTGHGSESNDDMLASAADWFSPGSNDWPDLKTAPRASNGKKVSLLDTDHVFGVGGDQKWVWKAFLRGHNVLFMDPYDDPAWAPILAGQRVGVSDAERARRAMGHARSCSMRIDLAASRPAGELASTGYCLAVPGQEYLVYLPEGGTATVDMSAAKGKLSVVWMHPITGKTTPGVAVDVGRQCNLKAPVDGDVVLYLRSIP